MSCYFLLGRKLFERRQDSVCAGIDADGRNVAPSDYAIGINNEERALRKTVLGAIDPVGAGDGSLGLEVGQKRKMQLAVRGECQVAPGPIHRDPQQLRVKA